MPKVPRSVKSSDFPRSPLLAIYHGTGNGQHREGASRVERVGHALHIASLYYNVKCTVIGAMALTSIVKLRFSYALDPSSSLCPRLLSC